jgi:hypothetical protein
MIVFMNQRDTRFPLNRTMLDGSIILVQLMDILWVSTGQTWSFYGCWFWHSKLAQYGGLSWPTLGQSELYPVSQ